MHGSKQSSLRCGYSIIILLSEIHHIRILIVLPCIKWLTSSGLTRKPIHVHLQPLPPPWYSCGDRRLNLRCIPADLPWDVVHRPPSSLSRQLQHFPTKDASTHPPVAWLAHGDSMLRICPEQHTLTHCATMRCSIHIQSWMKKDPQPTLSPT